MRRFVVRFKVRNGGQVLSSNFLIGHIPCWRRFAIGAPANRLEYNLILSQTTMYLQNASS